MRIFLLLGCFFLLSAGDIPQEDLRSQIIEKITLAEDQEWADLKGQYEDKVIREILQKLYTELSDDRSRISEKMGSDREQFKLGVIEWLGEFSQAIDTDADLKNFYQNMYDKVEDWDSMVGNALVVSLARTKSQWGSERLLDIIYLCLEKPCLESSYHFLEGLLIERSQDEKLNEVREKFLKFQMSSHAPDLEDETTIEENSDSEMAQPTPADNGDKALFAGFVVLLVAGSFMAWKKFKK